jgi:D-alanyl-D-alanine carboxypeptidase
MTLKHIWRTGLFVLALALNAACSDDPAGPSSSSGFQGFVDSLAIAHDVPGLVVAVREAGGQPEIVASGRAHLGNGRRMSPADRFRVASLTKPMVSTVILQLADEGLLALDDPVARFLPGILPDADALTIRQLLNHTTGLGDYIDDPGFVDDVFAMPSRVWTPQELIAIANAMPRRFAPGATSFWDYSNTNYILLGLVAEEVTGQPIGTLLRTRVFEPLGMASTYFSTETSLLAPYAEGYVDLSGIRNFAVGTLINPTTAGAAGAVVSTAGDLLRFVEALAAGELISPAAHAARLTTVPASRVRLPGESFDVAYGLGVLVGDGWIGHDGAIPGYEAEAYSKSGVGTVVVLINKSTVGFAVLPVAIAVRDRALGR